MTSRLQEKSSVNMNQRKRMLPDKTTQTLTNLIKISSMAMKKQAIFDTLTEAIWIWAISDTEMAYSYKSLILDRTGNSAEFYDKLSN